MSASLIGRLRSSAFRLSTTAASMSLVGSCFSPESAHIGPSIMCDWRRGQDSPSTAGSGAEERRLQGGRRQSARLRPDCNRRGLYGRCHADTGSLESSARQGSCVDRRRRPTSLGRIWPSSGEPHLIRRCVSTPQQKCISWPEQKYISDAGKKAPRTGGLSSDIRLGRDYPPVCPSWHGVSGSCSD
jgi:hypothetical protein